jgi:dTDP-4-amino-4,6-dideoxygalactose transaminase
MASTNGKMSEYHAAVGLAELDAWRDKLAAFEAVAQHYRREMGSVGLQERICVSPDVAPNYVLFRCEDSAEAERATTSLNRNGIDFRLWYGDGLHRQSYYAHLARDELPVTEKLAPSLLGLPVAPDLGGAAIARVVSALTTAVAGQSA